MTAGSGRYVTAEPTLLLPLTEETHAQAVAWQDALDKANAALAVSTFQSLCGLLVGHQFGRRCNECGWLEYAQVPPAPWVVPAPPAAPDECDECGGPCW